MNRIKLIDAIKSIKDSLSSLQTAVGFGLNTSNVRRDLSHIASRINRLRDEMYDSESLLPVRGLREYLDREVK